jgi:hypothetical protein
LKCGTSTFSSITEKQKHTIISLVKIFLSCLKIKMKYELTDYIRLHEKCNRLQLITITNYDYPMSGSDTEKEWNYNYFIG